MTQITADEEAKKFDGKPYFYDISIENFRLVTQDDVNLWLNFSNSYAVHLRPALVETKDPKVKSAWFAFNGATRIKFWEKILDCDTPQVETEK